jgi:hypothetical protein
MTIVPPAPCSPEQELRLAEDRLAAVDREEKLFAVREYRGWIIQRVKRLYGNG